MIKQFKITPLRYADKGDLSNTLVLDLFNPYESGVAVKQVTGLGPVKAKVNMTEYASVPGSKYNGSKQNTRVINFSLVFIDDTVIVEKLRHRSYLYFPVGESVEIEIETDFRKLKVNGYVESNEPNIWGSDLEGTSVSILCESPYLEALDMTTYEIKSNIPAFHFPFSSTENPKELLFGYPYIGDNIIVHNVGEVESGCIFEIIAIRDISNPTIYNSETNEYFQVLVNMDAGDMVTINTNVRKKSVYLKRGKTSINVINYMKEGSTWFTVKPGDTPFSILYSETITKTKTNTELTFNINRNNYTITNIKPSVKMPVRTKEPTIDDPQVIVTPDKIECLIKRRYWYDENTPVDQYDISDEDITMSQMINSIPNFGGGYIDIQNKKLVMTHVKFELKSSNMTQVTSGRVSSGSDAYGYLEFEIANPSEGTIKPSTIIYADKYSYRSDFNGIKNLKSSEYLISNYFSSNSGVKYLDGAFWNSDSKLHVFTISNNKLVGNNDDRANIFVWNSKKIAAGFIVCELNEPINYDILKVAPTPPHTEGGHFDSSTPTTESTTKYVVNPELLSSIELFNNIHAIVNTIDITCTDGTEVSLVYNISIKSIYDYVDVSGLSYEKELYNAYPGSLLYFVVDAPYNASGYTSCSVRTYNSDGEKTFTMDWSGIENTPTFYGGTIDFTNGKLINKYSSDGSELSEPTTIDITGVATTISSPNDKNGWTVSIPTDFVFSKIIYPLDDSNTKNRMNLRIHHSNYYYGI